MIYGRDSQSMLAMLVYIVSCHYYWLVLLCQRRLSLLETSWLTTYMLLNAHCSRFNLDRCDFLSMSLRCMGNLNGFSNKNQNFVKNRILHIQPCQRDNKFQAFSISLPLRNYKSTMMNVVFLDSVLPNLLLQCVPVQSVSAQFRHQPWLERRSWSQAETSQVQSSLIRLTLHNPRSTGEVTIKKQIIHHRLVLVCHCLANALHSFMT